MTLACYGALGVIIIIIIIIIIITLYLKKCTNFETVYTGSSKLCRSILMTFGWNIQKTLE